MKASCATRAVKVLNYLHRTVPQTVPRSSLNALEKLPSSLLAGLHAASDWDKVTADAELKNWLANNPIPSPNARVSGKLFHGTLVFVQLIFQVQVISQEPNQPPVSSRWTSSMSAADVQTALKYATLAVQPIHRYASQYGPNSISVWPDVMPFTASTGSSFTELQLESWVEQCAMAARNDNVSNPCIVILHNPLLPNSPVFENQSAIGYHYVTGDRTPYCYVQVFGQNLTIADSPDQFYAFALSHEIAEMVVDPLAPFENPEVCDPCSANCFIQEDVFDYFDQNGVFLGGTPVSGFAFFINPVVNANATLSHGCLPAGENVQNACIYPPPFVTGELLSYGDAGTRGNVSDPVVVGFSGWLAFKFLFGGMNAAGQDRIYAVNQNGELLSYGDDGTQGNVSDPVVVGRSGWWPAFKFLFCGRNAAGQDGIYAVTQNGELLFYTDDGTQYNVSDPVVVGRSGWLAFKFLVGGRNAAGQDGIYAVTQNGELLFYRDDGTQYNVSDPVVVGFGGWSAFESLFADRNKDRIYAVAA